MGAALDRLGGSPMSPVTELTLWIPGEPRGQARARHGRFGSHKSDDQVAYERTMQTEWIAAGRPVLEPGPYGVTVKAYMARPAGHFRRDGSLSTAGRRSPYPTKRPDGDNILKQCDCLVAVGALPDDAAAVAMHVFKFWAGDGVSPACISARGPTRTRTEGTPARNQPPGAWRHLTRR